MGSSSSAWIIILAVVVIIMLGIICWIYIVRPRADMHAEDRHGRSNNNVVVIQARQGFGLEQNQHRSDSERPALERHHQQEGPSSSIKSLTSFDIVPSDQQRLDALLRMRDLCQAEEDDSSETDSNVGVSDTHLDMQPAEGLGRRRSSVNVSKELRAMQMFGGLEGDEEDDLLNELDHVIPVEASPQMGVDRDVQHAGRMFEQLQKRATSIDSSATPSPTRKQNRLTSPSGLPQLATASPYVSSWGSSHLSYEHSSPTRSTNKRNSKGNKAKRGTKGLWTEDQVLSKNGTWTENPTFGLSIRQLHPANTSSGGRRNGVEEVSQGRYHMPPRKGGSPVTASDTGQATKSRNVRPPSRASKSPGNMSTSSESGSRTPTPTTMF